MLQAFAENLTVATGQVIPFANVETLTQNATMQYNGSNIHLNAPGLYKVDFNATGTIEDAGAFGVQLLRNGTPVPQALGNMTIAGGDAVGNIAFSTLMSVNNCCCNQNVQLSFRYTGGAGTINLANVVVTKVR